MLLRCNKCVGELHDNASKKTDVLWLRTIKGRDFLVCKFHRGNRENRIKNGERIVPAVPESIQRPSEHLLPSKGA